MLFLVRLEDAKPQEVMGRRRRQSLCDEDGRPLFTFKVIRSLLPHCYRNVEYDNWRDAQLRKGSLSFRTNLSLSNVGRPASLNIEMTSYD